MNFMKTLWRESWGLLAVLVWLLAVGLGAIADGNRGARIIAGVR